MQNNVNVITASDYKNQISNSLIRARKSEHMSQIIKQFNKTLDESKAERVFIAGGSNQIKGQSPRQLLDSYVAEIKKSELERSFDIKLPFEENEKFQSDIQTMLINNGMKVLKKYENKNPLLEYEKFLNEAKNLVDTYAEHYPDLGFDKDSFIAAAQKMEIKNSPAHLFATTLEDSILNYPKEFEEGLRLLQYRQDHIEKAKPLIGVLLFSLIEDMPRNKVPLNEAKEMLERFHKLLDVLSGKSI